MTAAKTTIRTQFALLVPFAIILASLIFAPSLSSFERLIASTVILYSAFKVAAILKFPGRISGIYLLWPGLDPRPFQIARQPITEDGPRFGYGLTRLIIGINALCTICLYSSQLGQEAATWLAMASIIFAIHLGFSDMLTGLTQAMGWKVKPLFDSPLRAKSLSDFWSRRWNRPFVELDRIFFLPGLTKRFGLKSGVIAVFILSGLLHEFAISYPAGAGWGGPLAYFGIQAALMLIEKRFRIKGSTWTLASILIPLPILFHAPFREACVWPLIQFISSQMSRINLPVAMTYLTVALASAQMLVLAASFQVPTRLGWKEDLPKLSPFNGKLMWTYGAFTVYTIVSWSILTFVLGKEMVAGTTAGIAVASVIFLFWLSRIATDAFYFKSEDWPKGPFMQIGHALLNALFAFLVLGYATIISWNILKS